jgi:hypothetical protein
MGLPTAAALDGVSTEENSIPASPLLKEEKKK